MRQCNVLLTGASGTGKSVLVERILDQLSGKPDYCYFEFFYGSRSKGRKTESIQKDLRNIFTSCLQHAPAIVVLENLDVLAHSAGEQSSQDGEYYNRMADTVHQLIVQYTSNNAIAVIVTVNELQTLNKRLSSPRGRHVFQTVARLPSLERADREIILRELCSHINASKELDLVKFSNLTEGYRKCDLVQFVERAIFYAYRISEYLVTFLIYIQNEFLVFSRSLKLFNLSFYFYELQKSYQLRHPSFIVFMIKVSYLLSFFQARPSHFLRMMSL